MPNFGAYHFNDVSNQKSWSPMPFGHIRNYRLFLPSRFLCSRQLLPSRSGNLPPVLFLWTETYFSLIAMVRGRIQMPVYHRCFFFFYSGLRVSISFRNRLSASEANLETFVGTLRHRISVAFFLFRHSFDLFPLLLGIGKRWLTVSNSNVL
jgi:hypothetical protein